MSFRTAIIAVKDAVYKAVLSPTGLDITPYQLTIITRVWQGGRLGSGASADTVTLAVAQCFPVRQLSMKEIAGSGGRYREGDVLVEDISPPGDGGIGYTSAQLDPRPSAAGIEIVYVLAGGTAEAGGLSGNYALVEPRFDDWLSYALVLRRSRSTP